MAHDFSPREAGTIAWLAGERLAACPFPSYSGQANAWRCGWREARDAADDASADSAADLAGWSPAWEAAAERRQLGLSALD